MSPFTSSLLIVYLAAVQVLLGFLVLGAFVRLIEPRWATHLPLREIPLRGLWGAVVLLFIPVAVGLRKLYPWAALPTDPHSFRDYYLTGWAFLARASVYLLLWRWIAGRQQRAARGGGAWMLVVLLFSGSFAAFDWIMSLTPKVHSTAFGVIFFAGSTLMAFALCLGAVRPPPEKESLIRLNNVHLALICSWTYLVFMQFLIIWSGNLPREVHWYTLRVHGAWLVLISLVALGQFWIPFWLLLFRRLKSSIRFTRTVAAASVAFQFVYLFWLVAPALHPGKVITWTDALAVVLLGGVWYQAQRRLA